MAIEDFKAWIKNQQHKDELCKLYMYLDNTDKSNSIHTHSTYMYCANVIFNSHNIDFYKLSKDDINKILFEVNQAHKGKNGTRRLYYITLRKWLVASEQNGMIKHVVLPKVEINYQDKEILDVKMEREKGEKDELDILIETASHPRDSAIIALLWDSGCRVGELCAINIKHVQFDMNGARVTLPISKTKSRTVRVVFASSFLSTWIQNHQWKDNPDAPLFYSLRSKNGQMKRLTTQGVRRQLNVIGEKSGIGKHIHPHIFRHTRASFIAEHNLMSEMVMTSQFGWEKNSNMPAIYITLSDDSHEKAILKASGVAVEEDKKEPVQTTIRCPRCKELNAYTNDYCVRCTQPLSIGAVKESSELQKDEMIKLIQETIKNMPVPSLDEQLEQARIK
jgi:integrase